MRSLRSATCPLADAPDRSIDDLKHKPFFAMAGIGHPAALAASLAVFGERFVGHHWFGDHHDYSADDAELIVARARSMGAELIVTTEKDWSKLMWHPEALHSPVPFVRADVAVAFAGTDEQTLYDLIVGRYRQA
jgi:tetraacyldisaccharide-1-P 4'-kinase